jgi:hypothetical protein
MCRPPPPFSAVPGAVPSVSRDGGRLTWCEACAEGGVPPAPMAAQCGREVVRWPSLEPDGPHATRVRSRAQQRWRPAPGRRPPTRPGTTGCCTVPGGGAGSPAAGDAPARLDADAGGVWTGKKDDTVERDDLEHRTSRTWTRPVACSSPAARPGSWSTRTAGRPRSPESFGAVVVSSWPAAASPPRPCSPRWTPPSPGPCQAGPAQGARRAEVPGRVERGGVRGAEAPDPRLLSGTQ